MGAPNLSQYLWPDVAQGRQPQNIASSDPTNPVAAEFDYIWLPTGVGMTATKGIGADAIVPTSNVSQAVGSYGTGPLGSGGSPSGISGYETVAGAIPLTGAAAFSFIAILEFRALPVSALENFILRKDQDTASGNAQFAIDYFVDSTTALRVRPLIATSVSTGWSGSVDVTLPVMPVVGQLYVMMVRWTSGSPVNVSCTPVGSNPSWVAAAFSPGGTISVLSGVESNFQTHFLGGAYAGTPAPAYLYGAALSTRYISDGVAGRINENPYLLFEDEQTYFTFGASSVPVLSAATMSGITSTGGYPRVTRA